MPMISASSPVSLTASSSSFLEYISRAFSFAGTPSECVEKIKALEKKGISQAGILLYSNAKNSLKEVLRLLTDEIIPQFS